MMPVTRGGATLSDINTGFKTTFNNAFKGVTPTVGTIAMEVPSTVAEENYNWLGNFPQIREWAGDRILQNLSRWSYSIKNKKFESTVTVKGDAIEDDQYGVFSPLMAEMAREAALHPDRLAYEALLAGFASPCYDGQNFFDAEHPVTDEKDQVQLVSNMQAGAGPAWFLIDASRSFRPLVYQKRRGYRFVSMDQPNSHNVFWQDEYVYGCDGRSNVGYGLWQLAFGSKAELTHENYEAARAAMINFTRDGGGKLGVCPTHIVCGAALEGAARRVVNNDTRIVVVGDNQVVVSNEWKGTAQILSTPYL